jgi:exonuclease III
MRIVTWNMNHCRRSNKARAQAWEYLREELKADVALVQEARPPDDVESVGQVLDESKRSMRWGTFVVALNPALRLEAPKRTPLSELHSRSLRDNELPDSHPGASAVAHVEDARGRRLFTAVSLYGQWETMPDGRAIYSCARLHRIVSDLTFLLANQHRRPMFLAGDFNLTTQIAFHGQKPRDTAAARTAFERLDGWGLVDCLTSTRGTRSRLEGCSCDAPDACSHIQTFRLNNRPHSRPTQLDYVFASPALTKGMKCRVDASDDGAWALSDHCPIVVDFATS